MRQNSDFLNFCYDELNIYDIYIIRYQLNLMIKERILTKSKSKNKFVEYRLSEYFYSHIKVEVLKRFNLYTKIKYQGRIEIVENTSKILLRC